MLDVLWGQPIKVIQVVSTMGWDGRALLGWPSRIPYRNFRLGCQMNTVFP